MPIKSGFLEIEALELGHVPKTIKTTFSIYILDTWIYKTSKTMEVKHYCIKFLAIAYLLFTRARIENFYEHYYLHI